MRRMQYHAPMSELAEQLQAHTDEISQVTDALLKGQREQAVEAMAGLAMALATQSSLLGSLANQVVARAFASSANAVLDRQIAGWDHELDRRDLVIRVRDSVEVLLETVVIQLTRSLHRASEEVVHELGEMKQELTGLRSLLAESFGQGFEEALRSSPAGSPFWAGPPIEQPEYFVGRERQLREIKDAMGRHQAVQVLGETRMGKTSLLERARTMLPDGMPLARLNLQGADGYSVRELVLAVANELGRYRDIEPRLQRASQGDMALEILRALEALTPVALMIDEADVLAEPRRGFDEGFFEHCRHLCQARRMLWISASRRDLEDRLKQQSVTSRFLNDSKRVIVGELEPDAAASMMRVLGPERAERALHLAGGFAYGLQWLGHEWWLEPQRPGMEDHFVNAMERVFASWWRELDEREQALLRWLVPTRAVSECESKERRLVRKLTERGLVCERDGWFSLPGQAWRDFVADGE